MKIGIVLGENYACAAVLIISADALMGRYMIVMGRWNYIFGHRPTGDVPGIPDGQSAPESDRRLYCYPRAGDKKTEWLSKHTARCFSWFSEHTAE